MRVKLAEDIVVKTSGETKKPNLRFSRQLGSGETISTVDSTDVTPDAHVGALTAVGSGDTTEVQVTVAGGKTPVSFTATSADDTFAATAHGFLDDDSVHVVDDGSGNLPSGADVDVQYYVVSKATDTFKLSKVSGGSAISLSADGQGLLGADYLITVQITTSILQIINGEGWCQVRN